MSVPICRRNHRSSPVNRSAQSGRRGAGPKQAPLKLSNATLGHYRLLQSATRYFWKVGGVSGEGQSLYLYPYIAIGEAGLILEEAIR